MLAARPAAAEITLSQNFDNGWLNVAGSTVVGSTVNLEPRRFASSEWSGDQWWVHFKANGEQSVTPQFNLNVSSAFQGNYGGIKFVYSYDQTNCSFFDNGSRAGDTYSFSNNPAFTQDQVSVAYGLPCTAAMTDAHTAGVAASPHVTPTTSGNASLVIGQTPGTAGGGYTDDLGRSVPVQNLYGYKITDATATGAKQKVVITTGNHSGEPTGTHTLQGWLVTGEDNV